MQDGTPPFIRNSSSVRSVIGLIIVNATGSTGSHTFLEQEVTSHDHSDDPC